MTASPDRLDRAVRQLEAALADLQPGATRGVPTVAQDLPKIDQLLRYSNGRPLTHRRYDQLWHRLDEHLWHRLDEHLPWVAAQNISTHWLRHTTLTWVERNFGYPHRVRLRRPYRQEERTNHHVYQGRPSPPRSLLTGQPHPLAASLAELGFGPEPAR